MSEMQLSRGRNSTSEYHAIVIGGGPAGSTVASLLSQWGRRVLLLEKEVFPRHHIGESLLPGDRHSNASTRRIRKGRACRIRP